MKMSSEVTKPQPPVQYPKPDLQSDFFKSHMNFERNQFQPPKITQQPPQPRMQSPDDFLGKQHV